jgi:hypothetical protein
MYMQYYKFLSLSLAPILGFFFMFADIQKKKGKKRTRNEQEKKIRNAPLVARPCPACGDNEKKGIESQAISYFYAFFFPPLFLSF